MPELKTDGTIQVSNGKDFMYTSLKGIVVQPNQTGENMMDVVLPAPFKRLGAQIKVSVAAGDFQPVTPTSLVVNSFEMGGLRASLPYTLGGTTWGRWRMKRLPLLSPSPDSRIIQHPMI